MTGPLEIAKEAWGLPLPDWIEALARACARSNQAAVARALGRSAGAVSYVLRNKYGADTRLIEERVRGVYLDGKVLCPAEGEMPVHECQDWRDKSRKFAIGNPKRLRMYRACIRCPRNQKEGEE